MIEITEKGGEVLAKRVIWLAYQSSKALGMGLFRAVYNATEESVWENAVGSLDYQSSSNKPGSIYADYVFGRMMKLGVKWSEDTVEIQDQKLNPEYQSWCVTYPTVESLLKAASKSLN